MAKSNRIHVSGTEVSLKQSPPYGSPSSNPKSGQFQMMGTSVPLSRNSVLSPSSNPPGGQSQIMGGEISLSRTPVKGWGNAASLTMSERAVKQSQIPAVGKKGRR